MGMALDLWNKVRLEQGRGSITISGEGAESLSHGEDNLVFRAVVAAFQAAQTPLPPLSLVCENTIPLARGLGSSAAAVVGGLVAANALMGGPLSEDTLLGLATQLEGHPDNVAPALLGGCRIVVQGNGNVLAAEVPTPEPLSAVVFIPDFVMPTSQARAVLPPKVTRADAVFNLGRVALLVEALATGHLEHLRAATEDRLHQPARQALFPAMKLIIRAALEAGAHGAFLSGAGSSVLALASGREMTIGYEMADIAFKAGVGGTVHITHPSRTGAQVVSKE